MDSAVSWRYEKHLDRWVVAVFAFITAAGAVGKVFYSPLPGDQVAFILGDGKFLMEWLVVVFSLCIVAVSLRHRIDGHFLLRGDGFELDTGRSAPTFLATPSLFFELLRPSAWLKTDLFMLGSEYRQRVFPTRQIFRGKIDEIKGVSLEPSYFGLKVMVRLRDGSVYIDNIPSQEATRVCHAIKSLIGQQ